jgi:hypothetical protein
MKLHKNLVFMVMGCSGLFTVGHSAFAQSWTLTGASTNFTWAAVACSADGTKRF